MKILYISPENTVGTLSLWKAAHESNGHYCRTVSLFPSPKGYQDDICLKLPLTFEAPGLMRWRKRYYRLMRGPLGDNTEIYGEKVWQPGLVEKYFMRFRDWLWQTPVQRAIADHNLGDFDVYHFEWGMDFFRDGRFARRMKAAGKRIVCHYHGQDIRTRGVFPEVNGVSELNLTSEVDLLEIRPDFKYLFLPFDSDRFQARTELNARLRVAHAPTDRYYKGSDAIITLCNQLEADDLIEFDLIENMPHTEALERKKQADVFIDQIGDKGGWGYGMNSVESLAMGICTLTTINEQYQEFIPDHPFVNIDRNTLEPTLRRLVVDRETIKQKGLEGRAWVVKYHDYRNVVQSLYNYYRQLGIKV